MLGRFRRFLQVWPGIAFQSFSEFKLLRPLSFCWLPQTTVNYLSTCNTVSLCKLYCPEVITWVACRYYSRSTCRNLLVYFSVMKCDEEFYMVHALGGKEPSLALQKKVSRLETLSPSGLKASDHIDAHLFKKWIKQLKLGRIRQSGSVIPDSMRKRFTEFLRILNELIYHKTMHVCTHNNNWNNIHSLLEREWEKPTLRPPRIMQWFVHSHWNSKHYWCLWLYRVRKGDSANAVPNYQKLCVRVTHIWGNRRGQLNLIKCNGKASP